MPDPAAALRHLQKAIGYDALTFENADLRERLKAAEEDARELEEAKRAGERTVRWWNQECARAETAEKALREVEELLEIGAAATKDHVLMRQAIRGALAILKRTGSR